MKIIYIEKKEILLAVGKVSSSLGGLFTFLRYLFDGLFKNIVDLGIMELRLILK